MTIPGIKEPALDVDSLVVVSGVTGFIGSHVADQILAAGYRVRGTTRSVQKGAWAEKLFREKYGPDKFELAEVQDMGADDAFVEAVRGASGFVHVANDMTGNLDAKAAASLAITGALNAIRASAREPDMKRFVYTSSSFAATQPKPGKEFTIKSDTYNEEAIERASQPDPDGETVYAASKTQAEIAIWDWLKENKSTLIVNTVLPNANIGPVLSPENQGYPTTAGWTKKIWDKNYEALQKVPPQHYVNVQDDARLHVIGLAHPEVQGERLFAVYKPCNMNDFIKVMRKLYPKKQWDDFPNDERDVSTFEPTQRANDLLKEAYDAGFLDLEESVRANAAALGD